MSTIKSSDEHLTLNADGSSKDIKFQANGVEKASISSAGAFTSTTIDATALTGTIPNFTSTGIDDNADATAITIDSSENVGIGNTTPESWHSSATALQLGTEAALVDYSGQTWLAQNYYFDGAHKHITTDEASRYRQYGGNHSFEVAASGSADSVLTWTTAMTIDNSGAVTKPLQPAFLRQSSSSQNNMTADAATTVIFGDEIFDQNADVTDTTFTAPVTGKYFFSGSVRIGTVDKSFDHIRIQIETSNRTYKFGLFDPDQVFSSDATYWCLAFNILADMDSSDTAYISIFPDQGASITDIQGSPQYTFWSGHLVC